ncbi:MAG: YncE family protein [Bacteroidales bacterium]|nr:YncE family protein [Bacteroidales bacterium]
MTLSRLTAVLLALLTLAACRQEELIPLPETEITPTPTINGVDGFYLLNEGNMGSNKSTLDYWDGTTGEYRRNIFAAANPTVPKELGDVGNDLAIYGSRLYAVINCSNKVEIMDAATTRKLGQVNIPNCRCMAFDGPYMYVTSYAGPVRIDPDYKQIGYVAKVDTATMAVVDTVHVGYQPDGIAIVKGKAYVANSGGYMVPNYENTVSVIDLATMRVVDTIEIAINLHQIVADRSGRLWISSRGDYYDTEARLFCYDPAAGRVLAEMELSVGSMWLDGSQLYIVATQWSYVSMDREASYAVIDTDTQTILTRNFITDGSEAKIRIPYGVAVNPVTKEIYVTDALNYVNPGNLHCYTPDGKLQWTVRTGDIPAHFAFRTR